MTAAALPPQLEGIAQNPRLGRDMVRVLRAERRWSDYARFVWHRLEPNHALVWNWHLDCIGEHLEAVTAGEIRRLVINVPPGFSKSLSVNVLWPTWEWGPRDLSYMRYLSFAYSSLLTERDNQRSLRLLQSDVYQRWWGDRFRLLTSGVKRFDNDETGFRIASSVSGTGTGERGDRVLIDDPNNVKEAESKLITEGTIRWFAEVVPSRVNDIRTSAIVCIQQRTGVNDVTGHILKSDLGYEWVCLPMEFEPDRPCYTSLPRPDVAPRRMRLVKPSDDTTPRWVAEGEDHDGPVEWEREVREVTLQDRRVEEGEMLDPERFPAENVENDLKKPLRSQGGEAAVAGQLQQRPTPRGGTLFRREDFRFIDASDLPPHLRWARGYDLGGSAKKKSAYSAAAKVAVDGERVFIGDVARVQRDPTEAQAWIQAIAELDGADVAIDFPNDPGQAGNWQVQSLAGQLQGFRVHSSPESGDKEDRAGPWAAQVKHHNVYLVRAEWNAPFIAEAVTFPGGDFKDQVDATSRAYARALLLAKQVGSIPMAPKVIR